MGCACFACGGSGGGLWAGGGGEVGAVCLEELGCDWVAGAVAYKLAEDDYTWGYFWERAGGLGGISLRVRWFWDVTFAWDLGRKFLVLAEESG